MNGLPEIVGGVEDHFHILAGPEASTSNCRCTLLRDLKKESSTWAKENFDRGFTWQEAYAAFTVSPTATDSVRHYIAMQEAHHQKISFVDELRELLNAAGIEFDEKTFPVVSADSDHRLLSGNPSACSVSQLYDYC